MADPAFNRDPAFIHALVRLYLAFIRGPAFIRRRRLIEEIRYIYIYIYIYIAGGSIMIIMVGQWSGIRWHSFDASSTFVLSLV